MPWPELQGFDMAKHRQWVAQGAPWSAGVWVFDLLRAQGLEPGHHLLDFGAGSLRVGRFLMVYLERGRYYAIEPNVQLIEAARRYEVGDLMKVKDASFLSNDDFNANAFERRFDYVLISGIIPHAGHDVIEKILSSACLAAGPSGQIIGSFWSGGPHYMENGWVYPGQAPHEPDCIYRVLDRANFDIEPLGKDPAEALWFKARARV